MTLKETIDNDLKRAMIEKNAGVLSVLRMLKGAIRNKEISLRSGDDVALTDEQTTEVIASEIKKRKDSIVAYEQGGRQDLVDQEKSELVVLEKYLPAQMANEELEVIVKEVFSSGAFGPQDFGKLMGQVMPRVKGKADGNRVTVAVKKILGS